MKSTFTIGISEKQKYDSKLNHSSFQRGLRLSYSYVTIRIGIEFIGPWTKCDLFVDK